MLPKVEIECWLPGEKVVRMPKALAEAIDVFSKPKQIPSVGTIDFHVPRVWKTRLTEASELEIFGDLSPYRSSPLPPLPWGNEKYYEKKKGVIDKENAEIYNKRIEQVYQKYNPELIPKKQIKPGVVSVFRAAHNVTLENLDEVDG